MQCLLKQVLPKGNIVYEYNPLYNYRIGDKNAYLQDSEGHYLTEDRLLLYIDEKCTTLLTKENYEDGANFYISKDETGTVCKLEDGMLDDLVTSKLNFDIEHPVDILCLRSYDNSVNLILNDGKNIPRLINSRFTVLENNTYVREDHKGNTDTTIYDEKEFDTDTSLFKRYSKIPKISLLYFAYGGNLKVGNYTFYFKLADGDGNETDFIGQSHLVLLYVGAFNAPQTIRGGLLNENSNKLVAFSLTNIDSSYDYVIVYYSRATGVGNETSSVSAHKILNRYRVLETTCAIVINGNESVEDIPIEELNVEHFIASSAKAQTISLNMLFLGNVTTPNINYVDLLRVSTYFVPTCLHSMNIENLDYKYGDSSGSYGYYNPVNTYYRLGYWPEEIYRFGVVYIRSDNSLTPVFNIRGVSFKDKVNWENLLLFKDKLIDYESLLISSNNTLENAAGVIQFPTMTFATNGKIPVHYLKILLHRNEADEEDFKNVMSNNSIIGYFFVRLKRIPTILGQAFGLRIDSYSGIPLLPDYAHGDSTKLYYYESFISLKGELINNFEDHLIGIKESNCAVNTLAAICPEFELNLPYYNSLFTGGEFPLKAVKLYDIASSHDEPRYLMLSAVDSDLAANITSGNIISVPDNTPVVRNSNVTFRARAGEAESLKFLYVKNNNYAPVKNNFLHEQKFKKRHWWKAIVNHFSLTSVATLTGIMPFELAATSAEPIAIKTSTTNEDSGNWEKNKVSIARGSYGAYLGITNTSISDNTLFNIYIPGYDTVDLKTLFDIRIKDSSPYYPVSDRFLFLNEFWNKNVNGASIIDTEVFQGDCYICLFTHRINRNFQDPDAPNNDLIVDTNTWKDKWKEDDGDESEVNRGDVNAVQLGSWITIKCYASYNLGLRDWDGSYPSEEALTGHKRSFYPLNSMSTSGNTKIPESTAYNLGFTKSLGEKFHFLVPNVPYLKNKYLTRVMYSQPAAADSFKNGFREFKNVSYRDYPNLYGGIMKLVSWGEGIVIVFEHAVAYVPVNLRALIPTDDGTQIAVGAVKVIPESLTVLSDAFGTQWPESICTTEQYIYGVDTIGKKIWRTTGKTFECISELKVLQFLNENITLTEREMTPIIGVRNVKTHYNAYKHDVLFTYYDNTYGFEETSWSLCWNEILKTFVTFYSWIPSYSSCIDNIFFSFNRDISKWMSKLVNTDYGVVVEKSLIDRWENNSTKLSLLGRNLKNETVKFSLVRDNFGFHKCFEIEEGDEYLKCTNVESIKEILKTFNLPVVCLNIKALIEGNLYAYDLKYNAGYYLTLVFLTFSDYVYVNHPDDKHFRNYFWKHGQSGTIDGLELIKPCKWYGQLHPFEFEFIVGNSTAGYKQFTNMSLITNKVLPESAHYTITGNSYLFVELKSTMYFKQEYTKALLYENGSNILYNHDVFNKLYLGVFLDKDEGLKMPTSSTWILKDTKGNFIRNSSAVSSIYKATYFPLIYARKDTFNEIYDSYVKNKLWKSNYGYCYSNMSGTELIWDKLLNEFRICNHSEMRNIKNYGRAKGNLEYVHDRWNIQISPVVLYEVNELVLNGQYPLLISVIPKDISETTNKLPEDVKATFDGKIATYGLLGWENIAKKRKEMKLMDTYCRIKLRYTGDELAIISAINTQFNTY